MNVLVPGQVDGHPTLTFFFSSITPSFFRADDSFGLSGLFCFYQCDCVEKNGTCVRNLMNEHHIHSNHIQGRYAGTMGYIYNRICIGIVQDCFIYIEKLHQIF